MDEFIYIYIYKYVENRGSSFLYLYCCENKLSSSLLSRLDLKMTCCSQSGWKVYLPKPE